MTFAACPSTPGLPQFDQFNGGFVVKEPVCLPVEVTWDDQSGRTVLPFGKGGC